MSKSDAYDESQRIGSRENIDYTRSSSKMFVEPILNMYEFGIGVPVNLNYFKIPGNLSINFNGEVFDRNGLQRRQSEYKETYWGKLIYNYENKLYFAARYLNTSFKKFPYKHRWSKIVTTGDTLFGYNAGGAASRQVLVGSVVFPDGTLQPVSDYDMLNNQNQPKSNSEVFNFSFDHHLSDNTSYKINISRFLYYQMNYTYDPATGKVLNRNDFITTRFANPTHSIFFPPDNDIPRANILEYYWNIQPMQVDKRYNKEKQYYTSVNTHFQHNFTIKNEVSFGMEYKQYTLFKDDYGYDQN